MSIQNIQIADLVPIELQIADGVIDQYPRALVYDQDSLLLITIDLSHDNEGNYSGTSYIFPDKTFIKVVYIVYSDAAHTTENVKYERDLEVFYKKGWTTLEQEQIRDALGIDGDKTASTGGILQRIKNLIYLIFVNTA